jgi:enoyl-CoA hydratase
MAFELIEVRTEAGKVGIVTLNRPKQLNALNDQLMDELGAALKAFDVDESIGCMIVTGSEKAFAAGADIGAMASYGFADVYRGDYITRNWETIRQIRKPVIAAVSGFALGGGCELAMMCDFIIAADNAKFGQPEIKLGIIPGAGGTQRLSRLVGASRAKEIIFSGRFVDAQQALAIGLADKVVPAADVYTASREWASTFVGAASYAVRAAKEAIDRGLEVDLESGLEIERLLFASLFATKDREIGMSSFVEQGPGKAQFEGR